MKLETIAFAFVVLVGMTTQNARFLQQDYSNNQSYFNQLANPTLPFCFLGSSPICVIEDASKAGNTYANECIALLLGKKKTYDGFCAPPIEEVTIVDPELAENEQNGYKIKHDPKKCDCLETYNPVCANNGVTYMNLCIVLKCAKVGRVSSGACGSTNYIPPTIKVPCPCAYEFQPVCGQDNITYQNKCVAICAGVMVAAQNACLRPCGCTAVNKPVCSTEMETFTNECLLKCKGKTLLYQGACPTNNLQNCSHCNGYTQLVCGKNGVTYDNKCFLECAKVELYSQGACPSNKTCKCDDFYLPVCGLDKQTYKNECLLKCTNVKKAHNGECMDTEERPKHSCASCPQDDQPVCGSDGKTYQNPCKVKCEDGVEILYHGECEPILPEYCGCPGANEPVCGVDKRTYKNSCACKCMKIDIAYGSRCKWSKTMEDKKGGNDKTYSVKDLPSGNNDDLEDSDPIVQFLDPKNPPEIDVLLKYYEALFPGHKPISPEYGKYQKRFLDCMKRASKK